MREQSARIPNIEALRSLSRHRSRICQVLFCQEKSPRPSNQGSVIRSRRSKSVDLAEKYANNLTFEATPNERYALVTSAFSHAN